MIQKEKDYTYNGYNKNLKENARRLRKEMTEQERRLWYCFLKNYPVKFYRQRVINRYIADFYCSNAKLVIELDGSQHYTEEGIEYDSVRTEIIEFYGIEVLRITNREINCNFKNVCYIIDATVRERLENFNC